MIKLNESRRDFLRKMLAASVLTASCPHVLLGHIEPVFKKNKDQLQGIYFVDINLYPELREIWGSVRIKINKELVDGFFGPILITRVPREEFGKDFTCLYTYCPHEGREVFDLNKYREIVCSGHGTIFLADGTYIAGPAAQDLTKFHIEWDGADALRIAIPAVISGIKTGSGFQLAYLKQNFPNPCSEMTKIEFGIEKPANVKIEVFSTDGRKISGFIDKTLPSGHYTESLDVSALSPGMYVYKMQVNSQPAFNRTFIVYR